MPAVRPVSPRAVQPTNLAAALRAASWVCPLAGLAAGGVLLISALGQSETIRAQLVARSRLRLDAVAEALETHLTHVAITLETIAAEPAVRRMSSESRDFLQAVYDRNYQHHQLSEVYVIERSFNGARRPFMTFEREEHEQSVAEIHSLEREADEYAVQREHIERLASSGLRSSLVSAPIPLCVGERGIVVSTAIRASDELLGIVSGMVPISTLASILDTGDATEAAALFDADRQAIANCRVPPDRLAQLADSLAGYDWRRDASRSDGGLTQFVRPIAFGDTIEWTLVFVVDEKRRMAAVGWASPLPGLGSAATVGLLGVVGGVLAHTTRAMLLARQESAARAEQLSHVARVHSMSELASGLAHEFSQPLAAIVTYAEACARRTRDGRHSRDETLEDLEAIRQQAIRATATIDRVRSFVRNRPPQRDRESLNALVRESIRLLDPQIRQGHSEVRLLLDEALPPVRADAIQIMQVLINLVRNAIEAMAELPVDVRLLTLSTQPGAAGQVECRVEDRGPPMSDERFGRLFTPFDTSKSSGLGLGLPISRTIVELHGGQLRAERNAHGGLTFTFSLPVDRGERASGA